MIVDDSAVVRQTPKDLLDSDPFMEVMAVTADSLFAFKRMEMETPDVIISDVEMPRTDGISFLHPAAGAGRKASGREHSPLIRIPFGGLNDQDSCR